MNHLNEETIMEVISDLMNAHSLTDFETEDQMIIIDLVADGIRRYHTKELDKFLEDLHVNYIKKRNLSDL